MIKKISYFEDYVNNSQKTKYQYFFDIDSKILIVFFKVKIIELNLS